MYKENLALNNVQWLIYYKTKRNQSINLKKKKEKRNNNQMDMHVDTCIHIHPQAHKVYIC